MARSVVGRVVSVRERQWPDRFRLAVVIAHAGDRMVVKYSDQTTHVVPWGDVRLIGARGHERRAVGATPKPVEQRRPADGHGAWEMPPLWGEHELAEAVGGG